MLCKYMTLKISVCLSQKVFHESSYYYDTYIHTTVTFKFKGAVAVNFQILPKICDNIFFVRGFSSLILGIKYVIKNSVSCE